MFVLTEKAQKKLKELLDQQPQPCSGFRIQVVSAGCSGYQYRMTFEDRVGRGDEVIELGGIKLFVDSGSRPHLDSTTLDYEESATAAGFKFHRPEIRDCEGCGGSCR